MNDLIIKIPTRLPESHLIDILFEVKSYSTKKIILNEDIYKMILVLDGKIEISMLGEKNILENNDVFIINPYKMYIINPLEDDNLLLELNTHFIDNNKKYSSNKSIAFMINKKNIHECIKIEKLIKKLFYQYIKKTDISEKIIRGIILQIMNILEVNFKISERNTDKWMESIVIEEMRKMYINPTKDYSLNMIAKKYNLKSSNLSKTFKSVSGYGFVDFYHYVRLEKSIELMLIDKYSMTDIAEFSGFSNSKTLSESYKKYIGMPPTKYREKIKNNINGYKFKNLPELLGSSILKDIIDEYGKKEYFPDKKLEFDYEKIFKVDINRKKELFLDNNMLIDIASLGENWISSLKDVQNTLKYRYVRLELLFDCEDIFLKKDIAQKEKIDFYRITREIQEFENITINPLIVMEISEKSIECIIKNVLEGKYEHECVIKNIELFLDFVVNTIPYSSLKKWVFEIKINSLWNTKSTLNINEKNMKIYKLIYNLVKNSLSNVTIGIHLGDCNIIESKDTLKKMEEIIMNVAPPSFFSFDIIDDNLFPINGDMQCILMRMIEKIKKMTLYIKELEKRYHFKLKMEGLYISRMMMYYDWEAIPETYWESVSALSSISGFLVRQQNCLWVASIYYYNKKFGNKVEFIQNIGDYKNKYCINGFYGIKNLNYYVCLFLNKLGKECIHNEPGIIVTKHKEDIRCLIYQDMATCMKYVTSNSYKKNIFSDRNYRVTIPGLSGNYKIITKIIRSEEGTIFSELKNMGAGKFLNLEEKEYLDKRIIPKMFIENVKLYGIFDKIFELNLFEIIYVEIKKIKK